MSQGDFVYFFFRETAVEYINCGKVRKSPAINRYIYIYITYTDSERQGLAWFLNSQVFVFRKSWDLYLLSKFLRRMIQKNRITRVEWLFSCIEWIFLIFVVGRCACIWYLEIFCFFIKISLNIWLQFTYRNVNISSRDKCPRGIVGNSDYFMYEYTVKKI